MHSFVPFIPRSGAPESEAMDGSLRIDPWF
jgi:hypothetical protein